MTNGGRQGNRPCSPSLGQLGGVSTPKKVAATVPVMVQDQADAGSPPVSSTESASLAKRVEDQHRRAGLYSLRNGDKSGPTADEPVGIPSQAPAGSAASGGGRALSVTVPATRSRMESANHSNSVISGVTEATEGRASNKPRVSTEVRYRSTHVVHVQGAAKVGKSSLLLCMKGIDLPKGKPDASIQTLFLPKGDRGVHLILRDCGVSKGAWDAWNVDPVNRQVITSATSGAMGREVQIFVYAADAKSTGWHAHQEVLIRLRFGYWDSMLVLVRNKIDLDCQPNNQAESLRFFEQNGISADVVKKRVRFFDVSANTADGVSDALRSIARELRAEIPTPA